MTAVRVVSVVGARPQFIKAAAISRAMNAQDPTGSRPLIVESLIHTGQHYDYEMSSVFFRELGLPEPSHHLGIGSGTHGAQTGEMLKAVERVLMDLKPHIVLVHGDTNSTLAGSLAAAKMGIPVAHVEAGLRSFDRNMAEELNRVLTDHLATWLFCPSESSAQNLRNEGIRAGIDVAGDVMHDVLRQQLPAARRRQGTLEAIGVEAERYVLATIHRAETTDKLPKLAAVWSALERLAGEGLPVVVPLHPRTKKALADHGIQTRHVTCVPPVSYEQMLLLQENARVVLTDSGGVQKEAYWLRVPCVTMRDETEWSETLQTGWNVLAGTNAESIVELTLAARRSDVHPELYGDGHAAERIVRVLAETFAGRGAA